MSRRKSSETPASYPSPDGATTQSDRINLFDLTDNLFLLAPFNAATVT